jgi:hypothetical protein
MGAMMDILQYGYAFWDFLGSDTGKEILVGLLILEQALARVEFIRANSTFQVIGNLLKKLAPKPKA